MSHTSEITIFSSMRCSSSSKNLQEAKSGLKAPGNQLPKQTSTLADKVGGTLHAGGTSGHSREQLCF